MEDAVLRQVNPNGLSLPRILTSYHCGITMSSLSVTSEGQVTIAKEVRQKLGIRTGSKVHICVVGDHAELVMVSAPVIISTSGFGLLRSERKSVPADFNVASLPGDHQLNA